MGVAVCSMNGRRSCDVFYGLSSSLCKLTLLGFAFESPSYCKRCPSALCLHGARSKFECGAEIKWADLQCSLERRLSVQGMRVDTFVHCECNAACECLVASDLI